MRPALVAALLGLDAVEAVQLVGERSWRRDVVTGVRPALRIEADDDVVVAVIGWGQPPTRD